MYVLKNEFLKEHHNAKESKASKIKYVQSRLKKTAILSFFSIYKLFNKPAADGKVTKAAIEEYLEYIDDEKDAIVERCQKIWR